MKHFFLLCRSILCLLLILGAYILQAQIIYITPSGAGNQTGSSWANAGQGTQLQTFITGASSGTQIWIKAGTYQLAAGQSYSMKEGVKIYGSFAGTETSLSQRNIYVAANKTTLKGNGAYVILNYNNGLTNAALLDGFTITGGNSGTGAGMNNYYASPYISNCVFTGNNTPVNGTTYLGGGVYNYYSSPYIINCAFANNKSYLGGGITCENSSPQVFNCVFNENNAVFGGALFCKSFSNPVLTNCTIFNNIASGNGRNIYASGSSDITVNNSIICDINGNNTVYIDDPVYSSITYNYSLNTASSFNNPNNPDGIDNIWGTADDGLRLQSGSIAVNAGNNLAIAGISTDITGAPRIKQGWVDIGAYESDFASCAPGANTVVYVNNSAAASGNGDSWATAFKELRMALDAAKQCTNITTINVAKGTYFPTNDANRDSAFVIPRNNLKIYGGYNAGTGTRDIKANPTILSGDIGTPGVNTDNSYHVVVIAGLTGADSVVLDGFTVTGGNANNTGSKDYNGLTVYQSEGPALYLHTNNVVAGKIAIRNCISTGNNASTYGAGFYNKVSSPTITNCVFTYNTSNSGAGMFNYDMSNPAVTNCVFANNTATNYGGGMLNLSATPVIVNCTFQGNNSPNNAGAIGNSSATPVIANSIIWGNNSGIDGTANITYSIVQGGFAGTGNINADPFFVNSADADGPDNIWGTADDGLKLLLGSAALNTGSNDAVPAGITTDILNAARIQDAVVDMGAYETGINCPATLYVNNSIATGGNGSSWATAFKELRQALIAAKQCTGITTIYVAKGTYKPTDDTNRDSAFAVLRNNLKIYGGYDAATGTRNINANPTILSGDIGTTGDNTDNSYNVVIITGITGADSLVLDGFTITGGNANGSGGRNYNGNSISRGSCGGIMLYTNNAAGRVVIRNCVLTANNSNGNGGGMLMSNSSSTIVNCVFSFNTAYGGAGIYNLSSPTITNCMFSSNTATNGSFGAVFNALPPTAVTNCVFVNNTGSGMFNDFGNYLFPVTNCVFANNTGTGVYNYYAKTAIVNCTFLGNGSYAILNQQIGGSVITNSIIWGNSSGIIGGATVTYSNVQGGSAGTGNINSDPLFVNSADPDGPDNIWGTADDGLRLLAGSAAINTGNNGAVPAGITTDILNAARIQDAVVDMGAYEGVVCPSFNTIYVDSSIVSSGKGDSWSSAFKELRDALAAARQCTNITSILVAKGTYKPTSNTNRDSAFTIYRGQLKIYGGYNAATGTRNITANPTILSGDIGTAGNSTDNSYHVIVATGIYADSVVIDGFTIRDGQGASTGTSFTYNGRGLWRHEGAGISMWDNNGSGKIAVRNCSFTGNNTTDGACITNVFSSAPTIISNCSFTGNTAVQLSGGVYNYASINVTIIQCVFTANTTGSMYGGAIANRNNSVVAVTACIFSGNSAPQGGAISNNEGSTINIANGLFINNTSTSNGGAVSCQDATATIANCSFSGNTSPAGAAVYAANSNVLVANSAFGENINNFYLNTGTLTVSYSVIPGGYAGTGNINAFPLYVNISDADGADNIWGTADDGFRLLTGSPAVNAGNNSSIPAGITTDITGAARIQNTTVDMGAYEGSDCPSFTTLYVDSSISASGNGSSWATAFKELRDALTAAQCSNITTIYVAKGTYKPTNDANRDSSFAIYRSNLKIYGGYASGGGTRNVFTNVTTLSGDIGAVNDKTDNSHHVLVIAGITNNTDSLVVDGFTITNGNANGAGSRAYNSVTANRNEGAGIYLNADNAAAGKIAIRNCISINNNATANGGGYYAQLASPTITDCFFAYNNAAYGAGIFAYNGSSSVITNCVFTNNTATNNGGGIFSQQNSNPRIVNCTLQGNMAASGGAVDINNAAPAIVNSIIWDNNPSSNNTLYINYSLFNNTGYFSGNGAPNDYLSNAPLFINSANPAGADNIFGTADDGLIVRAGSINIDNGIIDSLPAGITTDILGALRVQGASVDLGAYESFICPGSGTLYVDSSVTVSGDGTSWATAYKEMSNAVRAANECSSITTINVAKGSYYPTNDTQDPFSSFAILRNNIKIYGGFPSGGGIRNSKINATILSGDINKDNNYYPYWADSHNSWHVVIIGGITGTDSLILDGFTVKYGSAQGGTITYPFGSVNGAFGGGLYVQNNYGVPAGNIAVRNCIFTNNICGGIGGAVYNSQYSSPLFYNCIFADNTGDGAGMSNSNSSSPIITNCVFWGNYAYARGAAIGNDNLSSPVITSSTFVGNTSRYGSTPYCIDYGNGFTSVTNSIIWGNSLGIGFGFTVSNSIVQGGYVGTGNFNTNPLLRDINNPAGPDNVWGTADDGLIVQAGSDAIDEGSNTSVPSYVTTDITGAARIQNTTVDMGAYEGYYCPSFNTLYVDNNVAASSYGSSWGMGFKELRNALKAVSECGNIDSILVAKGTYYPTGDMHDVDSAFTILRNKIKLYGGYDASTGIRNIAANPTVLNGYQGYDGSHLYSTYHVVVVANIAGTDSVILDGFRIANGGTLVSNAYPKAYGGTNITRSVGGGVCLYNNNAAAGKVALRNCVFTTNQSFNGGAVYNDASSPDIINCVFSGNTAYDKGAGISNVNTSSPSITNCVFTGNANATGVISNEVNSNPVIVNSTVYNNPIQAFYNNTSASVIKNSIIWKNNPLTIDPACTITYSDIQGGYAGTGNINLSPLFIDSVNVAGADNTWATADDGLQLQYGSNAINAGSNAAIPSGITTDITVTNTRIYGGTVDIGAYEKACFPYSSLYVNGSIATSGDGSSWANALKELRQALSAANQCPNITSVYVAKGTYMPTNDTNRDSAFSFRRDNIKIYGGYNAGTGIRNITANETILSGDIGAAGNDNDNSYHVAVVAGINGADSVVMDGFTITKGYANASGSKNYNGASVIQNEGAGIYLHSNTGAAGRISVRNCHIAGNISSNYGGGFYNQYSSPTITGCVFNLNQSGNGGAMFNYNASSPSITNCLFTGNVSGNGSAMFNAANSNPNITNCTFQGNLTSPAIVNSASSPVINNSIIWGNNASFNNTSAVVNNSIVEATPVYTGANNYNLDPQFINADDADGADNIFGTADDGLMLGACSPAINLGNNSAITLNSDLKNESRVAYSTVDMGAYEVQSVDLTQSTWKGANTNWNDRVNWCGGYVPAASTNVIIPTGLANYPVIETTTGIKNITLANAATITVNSSGQLIINGTYTNNGCTISNDGDWVMAGSASGQNFPGSSAVVSAMNNLEINNPAGIIFNKSFSITGTLTATAGNININDVAITLRSTAEATASVAPIQAGASISYTGTGAFIVERFINTGTNTGTGQHAKSWQFLSTPVSGQTIFQAWQENGAIPPGYGTWITGTGAGFDVTTVEPSLKYYDQASGNWTAVTNTGNALVNKLGYMLFVRGDRTVNTYNGSPNNTTMRSKGLLFSPTNPAPSVAVPANTMQSFGNPYASRIEFSKVLAASTGINDVFYVWDPKLSGTYNLGGYQTISGITGYIPTAGNSTTSYPSGVASPYIESGQAVFVKGNATGGNINFNENCKASGNRLVTRQSDIVNRQFLFASLFTNTGLIADGNLVAFDYGLGNEVNGNDAFKLMNGGENFGISHNASILAVEAREPLTETDTIYYYMDNLRQQLYQLRFAPVNMGSVNLQAFLIDRYSNTIKPISFTDSTYIDFNVTADAASSAHGRFVIVFKLLTPVDVTFVNIKAYRQEKNINVEWDIENEINTALYQVERSSDGNHFAMVGTVQPKNNNGGTENYLWPDTDPLEGTNFYRIKSIMKDGMIQYSKIVKVFNPDQPVGIEIYPNPVTSGIIQLQYNGMPGGTYNVQMYNSTGQLLLSKEIRHGIGNSKESVKPDYQVAHGTYQLVITGPNNIKVAHKIFF